MGEDKPPQRPRTPAPHPSRRSRESAMQPDIDYIRARQNEVYQVRDHESGQYQIVRDGELCAVQWRASEESRWELFPDRFKSVGGALAFLRTKGVARL